MPFDKKEFARLRRLFESVVPNSPNALGVGKQARSKPAPSKKLRIVSLQATAFFCVEWIFFDTFPPNPPTAEFRLLFCKESGEGEHPTPLVSPRLWSRRAECT